MISHELITLASKASYLTYPGWLYNNFCKKNYEHKHQQELNYEWREIKLFGGTPEG